MNNLGLVFSITVVNDSGGYWIKSLAELQNKNKNEIFYVLNCKCFSSRGSLLCCFDVFHVASEFA